MARNLPRTQPKAETPKPASINELREALPDSTAAEREKYAGAGLSIQQA